MINSRVMVMLVASSLTGCLPIPNVHYFAPAVSGIVVRDGHAVAGAEVRVTGALSSDIQSAMTQESGRFSVKPNREFRLTTFFLGDPLYGFSVKVVSDGKHYDGYTEYAIGNAPSTLKLACELSQPVAVLRSGPVYCTPVRGDK